MKTAERVAVLLDCQNIYYSAKELYGGFMDYRGLINYLVGEKRVLFRASAFLVRGNNPGEESFFNVLEKAGIKLRVKDLLVFKDGRKKGDWDMGIAMEALVTAPYVDTIILVSGDRDFIPLIRYLKKDKKRVEIAAFRRNTSAKLMTEVDRFFDLERASHLFWKPTRESVSSLAPTS